MNFLHYGLESFVHRLFARRCHSYFKCVQSMFGLHDQYKCKKKKKRNSSPTNLDPLDFNQRLRDYFKDHVVRNAHVLSICSLT